MKRFILTIAILSVSLINAQKKEISNAVKAIDAGDTSTAMTEIGKAESIVGDKLYLLEPSLLEQYYYAMGFALIKSGKSIEGAEVLAKITNLGSQKIYTGKDSNKNKVYFVGKEEADKYGNGINLKEETYSPSLTDKIRSSATNLLQAASNEANTQYNSKNFSKAGEKFAETYYLLKAAGQDNKAMLYYSALSYAQAENDANKNKAIEILQSLVKEGFTGEEITYTGKNKKTGQVENLDKKSYELFLALKDASDYTDLKTEKSESKEQELYQTLASLQFEQKQYDAAANTADAGLKKFPKSQILLGIKGESYYKSGKNDEFIKSLLNQLAINQNDKDSMYNLGVMYSKDPSKQEEAVNTFKKLVDLDPNYPNALNNLVFAIIGEDEKAIEEYKALKKEGKTDAANKVLEARRARFQKALPFAEKLYATDPNKKEYITLLKGLYMTTQNTAKYNEFKAKEEALNK